MHKECFLFLEIYVRIKKFNCSHYDSNNLGKRKTLFNAKNELNRENINFKFVEKQFSRKAIKLNENFI
jgi:hypothetical protein